MKNPINHVKATIGKFQTKHPYLSLMVEAPLVVGAAVGIAQQVSPRGFARPQLPNIPVVSSVYNETVDFIQGIF